MSIEPTPIEVLRTSTDKGALTKAAQELANSKDAASLDAVRAELESAAFLDKIDPPARPPASRLAMNVWKVLRTLTNNKQPEARRVIEALTVAPTFQKNINREDLLLEATQELRPPGERVVAYWTARSGAENLHGPVLQRILLANGSPEALTLFRQMMSNPGLPEDRRVNWIHGGLPRYRNGEAYLAMATAMVDDKLVTPPVRLAVIEAVFDWKAEWGPMHGPDVYRPAPRALMNKAAREQVRAVAKSARAWLSVPATLDAKIAAVLAELDAIDEREKPAHGGS